MEAQASKCAVITDENGNGLDNRRENVRGVGRADWIAHTRCRRLFVLLASIFSMLVLLISMQGFQLRFGQCFT